MKTNRFIVFILVLFCLLSHSCDNRLDEISALNSAPEIFLEIDGVSYTELTDSIRISSPEAPIYYNLHIAMADPDDNLKSCIINLDSAKILGYYNKQLMQYNSIRVDQSTVPLSLLPTAKGLSTITFELFDKFDAVSKAKLNLYVFDNLKPVAQLSYAKLNEYEVEIDASASYDRDQKYGGKIKSYHFNINGTSFTTPQPKVRHVFPQKGTYIVTLFVTDNSNDISETTEIRIDI